MLSTMRSKKSPKMCETHRSGAAVPATKLASDATVKSNAEAAALGCSVSLMPAHAQRFG